MKSKDDTPRGWKLGLLVASNVEQGYGQGKQPWIKEGISKATWYRRRPVDSIKKMSFRAFEREFGISDKTVKKHLRTWDIAAIDQLVLPSFLLMPDSLFEFDERHTSESWESYYNKHINPCVYFIGHKDRPDLPIKIGKANIVEDRLSSLQTAHYTELEVLMTVEGSEDLESKFHKKFAEKHVRGEWFQLTRNDLLWVEDIDDLRKCK